MKAKSLLILLLIICQKASAQKAVAQTDTTKSVYGKLVTRKLYRGLYAQSPSADGTIVYKLNDKVVDKATFDHYHATWKNIALCTPCILAVYGLDEKLIHKGIQYTDCPVGFWIEYFPNGKVKLIGHYKENDSGSWRNNYARWCSIRDGIWTYFDEKGHKLYTEYWKDDQFLKQTPEQSKPEIWTVQLLYNGVDASAQTFSPQQFTELKIIPKFKNSVTAGVAVTGEFEISAVGYLVIKQKFLLTDFNKIDIQQMLSKSGIPANKPAAGAIKVFVDGINTVNYFITIKN